MKLVTPETYFIGFTTINRPEIERYLRDTDQTVFLEEIDKAVDLGLSEGEILCSFYAKLCYASLSANKNKNISKTRAILDNIIATLDSGHGSVFEHCQLNFTTTECSRVFTHELVRHRVGTAFSQTSGRYVRTDSINLVYDPILNPAKKEVEDCLELIEKYYKLIEAKMEIDEIKDFAKKKKITSAMRRILPNGQSNEIGFSLNLRSLRNLISLRTSRHAEWEIRVVFNHIYNLVRKKYPGIFQDSLVKVIDGIPEITFKNILDGGISKAAYQFFNTDIESIQMSLSSIDHKKL